jgi:hypothetical protein
MTCNTHHSACCASKLLTLPPAGAWSFLCKIEAASDGIGYKKLCMPILGILRVAVMIHVQIYSAMQNISSVCYFVKDASISW